MTPVFLLAPMNRSGTKFLKSVLLAHPDISQGFSLEDYSLAYSDKLLDYAASMSKHWGRGQAEKIEHHGRLVRELGPFLTTFFSAGAGQTRYLLLTTPRPWGIRNVFQLFPESRVLVLVRDGRDTVESAIRSFKGGDFRFWVREWERGGREILAFSRENGTTRGERWEAVAFEELASNPGAVGRRVCRFLGLDDQGVDWSEVAKGPVRGSSEHGGPGHDVGKVASFNPVGRASRWSPLRRLQFNYLAGQTMAELSRLTQHDAGDLNPGAGAATRELQAATPRDHR